MRREVFISWMQISYQSVIVEEKKRNKVFRKIAEKTKLLWVVFWIQDAYGY